MESRVAMIWLGWPHKVALKFSRTGKAVQGPLVSDSTHTFCGLKLWAYLECYSLSCCLIHIEILRLNKHPPQPMQSQRQWWRKIYNLPINLNWLTPRPNHSTEHSFSSSHHHIPLLTWMNFKSFARNFPFMKTWPFSQSIIFRSSRIFCRNVALKKFWWNSQPWGKLIWAQGESFSTFAFLIPHHIDENGRVGQPWRSG